jgi:FkbM family methyltransferase
MSLVTIEGHTLCPRFISADSVVLDIGANIGNFSRLMAERFGCQCHAIEANPDIIGRIPISDHIRVHHLAIAGRPGQVRLRIHQDDECSSLAPIPGSESTGEIEVRAETLESLAQRLNISAIDVVKMDIEGSEIEVLDSTSDEFLRTIAQLTLEIHDFTGQVSKAQVQRVLERLRRLGFFVIKMARGSHIDTLAINRSRCQISTAECLFLRYGIRNWRGLKRMMSRWLGAEPPPNARSAALRP